MRFKNTTLTDEDIQLFRTILKETAENSRFIQCCQYIQHGKTTVRRHCIRVAYTAFLIARKYKIKVNERELIRGALLHDYFLYDWHEKCAKNSIHGYTHPKSALNEAVKDFNLSDREKNMILRHMFPLTPCPPKYREGWILCIADKICATRETIKRNGLNDTYSASTSVTFTE